jgi:NAD(P)H-quinone oxidoreductase subunit 5
MTADALALPACLAIVLAPLAALVLTATVAVLDLRASERATNRIVQAAIGAGLAGAIGMATLLAAEGRRSRTVDLGEWIAVPDLHFRFGIKFLFDGLSLGFLLLSLVLCAVVGAFSRVYLHREPGYRRFYLLFALFVLGMSVSSIAGTIELSFAGWELAGLSSALLVGYFQDRAAPVRNALRVWTVYRFADAAFLAAAVALHHVAAEGDFARMTGDAAWPAGVATISPGQALMVGLLLVIAAAGQSALVPFSGWLPRAMEGPTPSSAIFYGALSVHLGAFLLLRVEPVIERSPPVAALCVALGGITAAWAALAARVQSDVKSALAFASLTQVGIIVAEIGLGLRWIALLHIVGHASLRTLQLLRAPSILHDHHRLESAVGGDLAHGRPGVGWLRSRAPRVADLLYRMGYERSLFDALLDRVVVTPFERVTRACQSAEDRWTRWLAGDAPAERRDSTRPEATRP